MTITCPICELDLAISPYPVDRLALGDQPCFLCNKVGTFDQELVATRVRVIRDLPATIIANLKSAGVPTSLLTATWAGVSAEARAGIPKTERQEVVNAHIPGQGWGLQGGDGAAAIAALLSLHARAWYARELIRWEGWPTLTLPENQITWIDWAWMCAGWDPVYEEGSLEYMTSAKILILAGLGGERSRRDRQAGKAMLAKVVASRQASRRPIIWTSTPRICEFYGAEICFQLVKGNPGIVIDSGSGQMPRPGSPVPAERPSLSAKSGAF